MHLSLFNRICTASISHSDYLLLGMRPDFAGTMGISTLLKDSSAFLQLSYGIPAELVDSLFDTSETTAAFFLRQFCSGVSAAFKSVYLR